MTITTTIIKVDKLNYYMDNVNSGANKRCQYELVSSSIISGRYSKGLPTGYDDLLKQLPLALKSINAKGKFIYLSFDKGVTLFTTLGLTGGVISLPLALPSLPSLSLLPLALP